MKDSKIDHEKLKEKLRKGLALSFKKLAKQKKAENAFLVFSENGK